MPADQPNMEEILSSIRSTLEEETAKVGQPSADEDVLDLAAMDVLEEPAGDVAPPDELIDLNAFGDSGEQRVLSAEEAAAVVGGDLLTDEAASGALVQPLVEEISAEASPVVEVALNNVPVAETPAGEAPAAADGMEDEFDRLLAELGGDPEKAPEPALSADDAVEAALQGVLGGASDEASAPVEEAEASALDVESAPVASTLPSVSVPLAQPGARLELPALSGVDGLQVALPVEVLAAALRPMIQGWLAEQLPGVVERLVKEEISKLASQ